MVPLMVSRIKSCLIEIYLILKNIKIFDKNFLLYTFLFLTWQFVVIVVSKRESLKTFLTKFIKQINYFIDLSTVDYYFDPSILRQQLRFLHAATGFIISIESSTAQKTTHGTDVHSAIMTLDICVTLTHWRVHVRPHLLSLLGVHQCARRINTYVYWHTLCDVSSFPKKRLWKSFLYTYSFVFCSQWQSVSFNANAGFWNAWAIAKIFFTRGFQ